MEVPRIACRQPFLITLLLEMQTTIFLRTEMSRKLNMFIIPAFER